MKNYFSFTITNYFSFTTDSFTTTEHLHFFHFDRFDFVGLMKMSITGAIAVSFNLVVWSFNLVVVWKNFNLTGYLDLFADLS